MYNKSFCTTEELTLLLAKRGLKINSPELMTNILTNVGYATFDSYCTAFLQSQSTNFRKNTSLSSVWSVYLLDKNLRNTLFPIFLDLEQALRTRWAEFIAEKFGPFGYLTSEVFDSTTHHLDNLHHSTRSWIASTDFEICQFRKRYGSSQNPPIWHFVRSFTFGEISRWIRTMNATEEKEFFQQCRLPFHDGYRHSSLQALTQGRNLCAHGRRIWNVSFPVTLHDEICQGNNPRKIASLILLTLQLMEAFEFKTNTFIAQLDKILSNLPNWQYQAMGFKSKPVFPLPYV